MTMRKFKVAFCAEVEVTFDDSLLPDDEWRTQFYASIDSLEKVAEHFAFNHVVNSIDRVSRLDGWADRTDDLLSFGRIEQWYPEDIEAQL